MREAVSFKRKCICVCIYIFFKYTYKSVRNAEMNLLIAAKLPNILLGNKL